MVIYISCCTVSAFPKTHFIAVVKAMHWASHSRYQVLQEDTNGCNQKKGLFLVSASHLVLLLSYTPKGVRLCAVLSLLWYLADTPETSFSSALLVAPPEVQEHVGGWKMEEAASHCGISNHFLCIYKKINDSVYKVNANVILQVSFVMLS